MMNMLLAAALLAAVVGRSGTASTPTNSPSTRTYTVAVDWAAPPVATASTAATVEVDCCEPFLTRDPAAHLNGGGSFSDYTLAMRDLGADFVRWASWYVHPPPPQPLRWPKLADTAGHRLRACKRADDVQQYRLGAVLAIIQPLC